jgi:hypothetical protein
MARASSGPARDPSSPAHDPSTAHSTAPPNGPVAYHPTPAAVHSINGGVAAPLRPESSTSAAQARSVGRHPAPATIHTIYGAATASLRQVASPSSPSSPFPESSTSATQGRSKFQRWNESAAGSPDDGLQPRSWAGRPLFRDTLLHPRVPLVPALTASSPREPSPLEIGTLNPHHEHQHRWFRGLESAPETTLGGWTRVESRKAKKRRLRALRARRPVPNDLKGHCFNCFADNHLAAFCHLEPRCFRCKTVGHRSYYCPGPVKADRKVPVHRRLLRGTVWNRLSTVEPTIADRVPQYQLPRVPVWKRLQPSVPLSCKKKVCIWRRISPPGIEKGPAHHMMIAG